MIRIFSSQLSKQIAFFLGKMKYLSMENGIKEELREGGRGMGGGEIGRETEKKEGRRGLTPLI